MFEVDTSLITPDAHRMTTSTDSIDAVDLVARLRTITERSIRDIQSGRTVEDVVEAGFARSMTLNVIFVALDPLSVCRHFTLGHLEPRLSR
jgi:hypothetical protein